MMRRTTIFALLFIQLIFSEYVLANHHVGVFCATDEKIPKLYKDVAFELGKSLAQSGHNLITGGANSGLMNAVVNGFISEGDARCTHAVIPSVFQNYNVHHPEIPESNLLWTDTIHQRLQAFDKQCDTMVILPGGFGTLHELMDFLVPKQWGLTDKKIIILNVDHYWDYLLLQFETMVQKMALKENHLDLFIIVTNVKECLDAINTQQNATQNGGLEDRYWEVK